MSTQFVIKRSFAITAVNAYYEIKKEGNNQEDIKQFKKNFVKFIVQYMDNTYFTEEIAKRLFLSIITLEDEHEKDYTDKEWKCEKYYNWSPREVEHLFLSIRNYHFLNGIKSIPFEPTKEMTDLMTVNDWVIEENDCYICKWHGYDMDWPNIEERGKFYYCIPGNINSPVCESCVKTNCLDINISLVDEPEYGTDEYLEKNHLIKCINCGNIWDGCAQCNCWKFSDYLETPLELYSMDNEDTSSVPTPEKVFIPRFPRPTKPLPLPSSLLRDARENPIIKDLTEQNKNLVEQTKDLEAQNQELQRQNKILCEQNKILLKELSICLK
jgi:hypothetical protein